MNNPSVEKKYSIKDIYIVCDKYDFSTVDIGTKNDVISKLILYIKGITQQQLLNQKLDMCFTETEINLFEEYLNDIVNNKVPLQYITHLVSFYNEQYYVNDDVLIPRQDTEILVEKVLEYVRQKSNITNGDIGVKFMSLLDMCSGSGAIGISIVKNSASNISKVTFCDISENTLKICEKNAKLNKINDSVSISYINSDLFTKVTKDEKYDIIVSNPPYIRAEDMASLSDYVKKEPHIALDGGIDGLDIYRRLLDESVGYIKDGGCLFMEIGYDQKEDLINLINNSSYYNLVEAVKDLNSNDRVIICRFHKI